MLILGSNKLLTEILAELNVFLPAGSEITIADDFTRHSQNLDTRQTYPNLVLEHFEVKSFSRDELEQLILRGFNHILILSDSTQPSDLADSWTLTVLLHIRDLAQIHNLEFGITSEMLDIRNQELARGTHVSDFVISNNITSLIMAQIAENRLLAPIFEQLLDSAGSEIYLKPATRYVAAGKQLDGYALAQVVSSYQEVFIGYKKMVTSSGGQIESRIVTNPNKSQAISFTDQDWLIVLAES